MATINEETANKIMAGEYGEDQPRFIVKYDDMFGGKAWAVLFASDDPLRYHESAACNNVEFVWKHESVKEFPYLSRSYCIATGKRPRPEFLWRLEELMCEMGFKLVAGIVTEGSGCYNIGIKLDKPNLTFIKQLTMGLQPARWSNTSDNDPMMPPDGEFKYDLKPLDQEKKEG